MSPPEARPLVCVRDAELADCLLRLGAAAGADVEVPVDPVGARPLWSEAPLVVVSMDVAAEYAAARLPHRAGLVIVVDEQRNHPDDPIVWRLADELGAEHVVFLPTAEAWLVDRYAEAVNGPRAPGRVVAVVGGRGGAGASVLATALAVTAARTGSRAMLVDADPLGGGLDLLLGRENTAGLRWPDLVDTAGRMSPPALHDALPRVGELCVLSWDRGDVLTIPTEAAEAALEAGRRCSDVLVVDLPRRPDDAAVRALQAADLTLLIVPAEVRACAAASRVMRAVRPHCARLACVVRGPAPAGLRSVDLATSLELPLAGVLRAEPRLAATLERGDVPAASGRGPLADFSRRLLADLGVTEAPG
ncbi:septum site-determining protein Ssd [Cryptosporangium aurantiacum]|uniref:Helicase/secretion neighborhood CpaE-like protein n=1 Tax=Cryptosporangium aurantiacum TaxID=134849 RepID=A0A1M7NHW6_9ACTN|nr:septum site-determining protein Ssd [Cryptosporangium aurantiacum]SHN02813.1 helicase/secretion neighborhood CpaE-like protein [Cryptosporangium aurantiacum]